MELSIKIQFRYHLRASQSLPNTKWVFFRGKKKKIESGFQLLKLTVGPLPAPTAEITKFNPSPASSLGEDHDKLRQTELLESRYFLENP